jgi:hypothetical protein
VLKTLVGMGVAVLCCMYFLMTSSAGIDDPIAELTAPSIEELEKLPVGLKITHSPNPGQATETPRHKSGKYTWFFKTTVRATDSDVKLTQFGAFSEVGGKWVFGNFTSKPFTPKDFAEWYSCTNAELKKAKDYADPSDWGASNALQVTKWRSYYLGTDSKGQLVKGEAIFESKSEIDPKRPTDAVSEAPGDLFNRSLVAYRGD